MYKPGTPEHRHACNTLLVRLTAARERLALANSLAIELGLKEMADTLKRDCEELTIQILEVNNLITTTQQRRIAVAEL